LIFPQILIENSHFAKFHPIFFNLPCFILIKLNQFPTEKPSSASSKLSRTRKKFHRFSRKANQQIRRVRVEAGKKL
jgi:hypothetical protein